MLRPLRSLLTILALSFPLHGEITPADIHFTRQASKRMVFDREQALPLAALDPASIVDLPVMHPIKRRAGNAEFTLKDGKLMIRGAGVSDTSLWFSGFNPFATYELELSAWDGGSAGLEFVHEAGERLRVELVFGKGTITGLRWGMDKEGKQLFSGEAAKFSPIPADHPVSLVVQMCAVGFNVYLRDRGEIRLMGRADIVQHLDIRRQEVFRKMSTWVRAAGQDGVYAVVDRASAALTPGIGQADIRAITNEEGTPLLDDGRLWFTATTRGGGLPNPAQGVFSMNPGIFDPRFEGMIVFDRGDGLLRNELASHLFFDRPSGEWRGWTVAFSAFGDPAKREKKEILAVRSTKDPRRGFSIMNSKPMELVGDYEDPHGIFDKASGKWRMLLCQNVNGYKAAVFESARWDGGFQRIAGPADSDSTGTTIQKVGGGELRALRQRRPQPPRLFLPRAQAHRQA
ncbi:hypothetical protein [Haloferula sp. BvORR071]|uniref:hypothetical protein n=1 Tax=Haloferula sp. BvORR071 TaxID=1396141 RepID=UPI0005526529|nr:hypothetical protein [Haloferula sp. BvORR071]